MKLENISEARYQCIFVEKKKEEMVGIVTLNRPPHNRVTMQMMNEVMEAVGHFDADPDIRLIMIKAAGEDFSRGGDVEEIISKEGWEANQFFMTVVKTAKSLRAAAKPTMAVVHGWTTAAGMVTAMSCDLVIAADNTIMGATAIDFGLFCPWGPVSIMPRIVGTKRSFELGATGELVPADHLLAHGVVNRMVALGKLDEAAMEFAAEITCKSPTAMMLHKKTFYAAQDMEYNKALDFGAAAMVQYHMTPEAKEGMQAFLEGRKPKWDITGYTGDWSVRRESDS
ncbi:MULTISPECIES: enoyl-CoA hydratase/isomerase family protein [unclassified Burkholderia]|uniref:enoyl-CoA hydratase/isomerase family protein n=1 Tax=unclassified Burkholderia TaxID=2613784 RepID=UPI002AB3233D|nr:MULTISPECIES: enoyl-CoA hydratase/isomerase family protein [unclassified Burkholderia]